MGPDLARVLVIALLLAGSIGLASALAPRAAPAAQRDTGDPQRIVSASLAMDEVLLALHAEDRVVALSAFAADPTVSNVAEAARRFPTVRGEPERILALRPDLVVTSAILSPETTALLDRTGLRVRAFPAAVTYDEIASNVAALAALVHADGAPLVDPMHARLADLERRLAGATRPRVLLFQSGGYTAGEGTLFDEALRHAGGINAAPQAGHSSVSVEQMFAIDPDVLATMDYRSDARSRDVTGDDEVLRTPGLSTLHAVREGRIVRLDPRHALSSSHFAVELAVDLARALHPDRMEGL